MKVSELKKVLETANDNAEIEVYDSDGNDWEIWNIYYSEDKKVLTIDLY